MHEYQNFSEDVENVENPKFLKKSLLAHNIKYMLKFIFYYTLIFIANTYFIKKRDDQQDSWIKLHRHDIDLECILS